MYARRRPSGAAELVAPDGRAWLHRLAQLGTRFAAAMRRQLQHEHTRFAAVMRRLQQAHPGVRLSHYSQRLDELEGRLQFALQAGLAAVTSRGWRAPRAPCRASARWPRSAAALPSSHAAPTARW